MTAQSAQRSRQAQAMATESAWLATPCASQQLELGERCGARPQQLEPELELEPEPELELELELGLEPEPVPPELEHYITNGASDG